MYHLFQALWNRRKSGVTPSPLPLFPGLGNRAEGLWTGMAQVCTVLWEVLVQKGTISQVLLRLHSAPCGPLPTYPSSPSPTLYPLPFTVPSLALQQQQHAEEQCGQHSVGWPDSDQSHECRFGQNGTECLADLDVKRVKKGRRDCPQSLTASVG